MQSYIYLSKKHGISIYRETNGTENIPKINAHIYVKLIFNKGAKVAQWRNDKLFNEWYRGSRGISIFNLVHGMGSKGPVSESIMHRQR